MKKDKKTVVYARTTTKRQNINLQLEAAKPFLQGIEEGSVLTIADSVTPKSYQPKGLQWLLDLIKNDQVDTLIVSTRDRLSRNYDEYMEIINEIYKHQVKVIFTSRERPLIHDRDSGVTFENILAMVREKERKIKSQRIKAGLKRKQL